MVTPAEELLAGLDEWAVGKARDEAGREHASGQEPGGDGGQHRDDEFWGARPSLALVRDYARARRAGPWATLGVVLTRVVAATGPHVVLPPLVGGEVSLNLYVGLVGESGSGKDAATSAAEDAARFRGALRFTTTSLGSGEGIAHSYVRRIRVKHGDSYKDAIEQHTESVLFTVAEIDTLLALGSRQGSTVLAELRRAWMGSALGFAYADPAKRLPVGRHEYRLCMTAGIQPARAGVLLDDADAGTPQRWLWFPATDPDAPDLAPDEPEPLVWRMPSLPWATAHGRTRLGVCAAVRAEVDADRLAKLRGQSNGTEGHDLLCRLKAAAALALLDGHAEIRDDDWALAGRLMAVSVAVRTQVGRTLADKAREVNRVRGEAAAEQAVVVEERTTEHRIQRVGRGIVRILRRRGDWVAHAELRRALASGDRKHFEDAIDRAVAAGLVEVGEAAAPGAAGGSHGRHYRVTQ
ncbi:MAG TPA: hypothetical protein VKP64_15270 [Mycobacteriales bacterium]|nr:hypothetical protein [Mycobacteriales bacterium]